MTEIQTESADSVKKVGDLTEKVRYLKHIIRKAAEGIEVAVTDIGTVTGEKITHPQKNAALWLVEKRLVQIGEMLTSDENDIPF